MATEAIGRADWELRGDTTGLSKDLADAEKKVAATGASVEKNAKATGLGFKVAAATAAVGFGLMAKGAIEMEKAQGGFIAATGASREEAVAFSKDMNEIVGTSHTVGMTFDEITAAGTEVARQFKMTGEEGQEMTEQFSAFAKVTGGDAVDAVNSMDDTLDAFHEPASRSIELMDLLIASNQKFGTDVGPQTVEMLGKMAPALQAMGADMEDGVALLNMFEDSGLDAAGAMRGLNSAVANLPEGTNIEDFLHHLQDLKNQGIDPTQEAIDVFGAKAGAGIANSLKVGGSALDGYRLSAEEVAGATEEASESMITTGDRIRMFAEKAGAALRGLGSDIGPLASGLGGLATLAMALPRTLTGPLTDGLKGAWSKAAGSAPVKAAIAAGGAIVGPIYSAGMKVGEAVTNTLSVMWDGVKRLSSLALKATIAAAGAASGLVYAAGTKIADVLTPILSAGWAAMGKPGSGPITAAGGAGRLAGIAMGAGVVLGLAAAAPTLQEEAQKLGFQLRDTLFGVPPPEGNLYGTVFDSILDGIGEAHRAIHDAPWPIGYGPPDVPPVPETAVSAAQLGGTKIGDAVIHGLTLADMRELVPHFSDVGRRVVEATGTGAKSGADLLENDLRQTLTRSGNGAFVNVADAMRKIGVRTTTALGKGISSAEATQSLFGEIDQLKDAIENHLDPREQALKFIGGKYVNTLIDGMESKDKDLRDASIGLTLQSINTLEDGGLKGPKGRKSFKQMGQMYTGLLATGMTEAEARAELAAAGVSSATIDELESKYGKFTTVGNTFVDKVAAAIRAGRSDVVSAINYSFGKIMAGQSPPPEGPLHFIDKWGENLGETYLKGVVIGLKRRGGLSSALSAVVPTLPSFNPAGAFAGAGGSSSVVVGDINVTVTGVAGDNAEAVGDAVGAKVYEVLDDVLARAAGGVHLRWSAGG